MTGATSFLGRNLVKTFIKKGYEVFALVRKNSASIHLLPEENERFHLMYGSLENLTCIEDYIKEANYFVHFAWDGSGNAGRANYEIQSKNVWYSMEALKIADRLGCESFWFPGSQAEYGVKHENFAEIKKFVLYIFVFLVSMVPMTDLEPWWIHVCVSLIAVKLCS